jgi:hypothetical protein
MKSHLSMALVLALAGQALAADDTARTKRLRVQYVGNADSDRGLSYARFLGENFVLTGAANRRTFDPASLADVDVVVLDWSQSDVDFNRNSGTRPAALESALKSPLGERNHWTIPTLLLGSAGHLLAAPWRIFGGSG